MITFRSKYIRSSLSVHTQIRSSCSVHSKHYLGYDINRIVRIETREFLSLQELRLGDVLLKGNHGSKALDESYSTDIICTYKTNCISFTCVIFCYVHV